MNQKTFLDEGYIVLRNLFSGKEISELRENVYQQVKIDKSESKTMKIGNTEAFSSIGDLLSKEKLSYLLCDPRIVDSAQKALGTEDIVYFRDSSYMVGTGFRGWHRDNVDRVYNNGPDWEGDYTIIRMGLYLQNHKNYSGGLKVKSKSHNQIDGKPIFIDNEPGDLVLWNLKTIHSGNAVRLKLFPNLSLHNLENHVPKFLKKDQDKERISLFMTFGVNSSHLNRYFDEYWLKRESTIEHIKVSQEDDSLNNSKLGCEILKFDI